MGVCIVPLGDGIQVPFEASVCGRGWEGRGGIGKGKVGKVGSIVRDSVAKEAAFWL